MVSRVITLVFLLLTINLSAQTTVGNYRNNFNTSGSTTSLWRYLWNAPAGWDPGVTGDQGGGFIGAPEAYRALVLNGANYTPDGDSNGTNNAPAGFLRLSPTGGHPGAPTGTTNRRDRYAIVAFTVPADGRYAIKNSSLSIANALSNGVEVIVFPGRSEAILRKVIHPTAPGSFDVEIGHLLGGMVIYLAFGPNGNANYDAFEMNFDIVQTAGLSLREQLLDGISGGHNPITISPGRYFVEPAATYVTVANFTPATPVTIMAEGVDLVVQTPNRAIGFVNSSNFVLKGLSIDYDPQLYRQGTVETINNNSFELRLHEGYPATLTSDATSGIIYDAASRNMKALTNTIYPSEVSQVSPGLFAVTTLNPVPGLQVGDYVSLTEPQNIPHAFYLEQCSDVCLDGLKIHGAPSFGLLSRDAFRVELQNVHVEPGPTPLRAAVPRLLSSNSDGIHFKHSLGQITLANCHVAFAGDDCFVLTNSYQPIIEKDAGNIITVATKARTETVSPGDLLYVYNPVSGTRVEVTVQAVASVALTEEAIRARITTLFPEARMTDSTFEQAFRLTLNSSIAAEPGGWAVNRAGEAPDFLIENCTVFNTRARGILVKASNGIVRNNQISYTHLPGIQVRPESDVWLEGDFGQNIIIEGNELNQTAIARFNSYAPIYVGSEGFENWTPGSGHVNLDIRRNTITRAQSASIMVEYADQVRLSSNRFIESHNGTTSSPFYEAVIRLRKVNEVTVDGVNLVMGINQANANLAGLISAPATGASPVTNFTVRGPLLLDQDQDLLPDTWEQQYFDNPSAANANADPDADGLSNVQEFFAGLDPRNADRFSVNIETGNRLTWIPRNNRFITVYSNTTLHTSFSVLAKDIPSEQGYYVLPPFAGPSIFYRLEIGD
jgi:parallel beta-helix repeat protein